MKTRNSVFLHSAMLLACFATMWGCGGNANVATVNGTVKLDGNPVDGAIITFSPKKGGSSSAGRTDSSGKYDLSYSRSAAGAEIGEHTVKITTYQPANPDSDPPRAEVPEKIPVKYNYQSQLTKEVKAGENVIDFDFKTADGPVMQPAALEKAALIKQKDEC